MTDVEKSTAFLSRIVSKFFGNTKDFDYKTIVKNMLDCFKALGCCMSLKVCFLHAHLNYFPQNVGDVSEELGERFHQEIKSMDVSMMADYCRWLKRDCKSSEVAKAKRRKFMPHTNSKSLI